MPKTHGQSHQGHETMTAEEFMERGPETLGRIEIVDGRVFRLMAQSELHNTVVRRLTNALERAFPPDGPCMRVGNDVAVRLRDSASGKLNAVYPDIYVRDCEPYNVNSVRDHLLLVVEVTSEGTIDNDLSGVEGKPGKLIRYARNGIPVYLVVKFTKDWSGIDRIEEYRLDWSGIRYQPHRTHFERLELVEPLGLDIPFADLEAP